MDLNLFKLIGLGLLNMSVIKSNLILFQSRIVKEKCKNGFTKNYLDLKT